jgi:N-acetylmuramoyl-L-alanine amidase
MWLGNRLWILGLVTVLLGLLLSLLWGCAAPSPQTKAAEKTVETTVVTESSTADSIAAAAEAADESPAIETPVNSPVTEPMAVPTPPANRPRVIAIDPGHGGTEVGAAAPGLEEKYLNLRIAMKLAALLQAESYQTVLTRDTDRSVSPDYTGGGSPGSVGKDLQARIDMANAAKADLFICIHNNGSNDAGQSGTEVWYNEQRTFAERNLALANLVLESIIKQLGEIGYPTVNRGIKADTNFRIYQGRPYNIYVLGPGTGARPHIATEMPGILGETLFLSNPGDAARLRDDATLDAIARGYRDAIKSYFKQFPN